MLKSNAASGSDLKLSAKQQLGHVLVGAPGCGKSTLAHAWTTRSPDHIWISTDQIRADLFGDAAHQGDWEKVEGQAIEQVTEAIRAGQTVIYDATNVKRSWRLGLLQRLAAHPVQWVAWQFTTSLETCKAQNEGRERQVPEALIERYYEWLKAFPPDVAEGFAAVYSVPFAQGQFDFAAIDRCIVTLPRAVQNRRNKNASRSLHRYSSLLAFEQLMYLMALLMHYPGLGNLQQTNPALLKRELNSSAKFSSATAEICAMLASQYGAVYADEIKIAENLSWLQQNGIVNAPYTSDAIQGLDGCAVPLESLHRYSDREAFERLMQIVRFMAHHPQFQSIAASDRSPKSLEGLMNALEATGNLQIHYTPATIRKDVEEALKPYGIMIDKRMRQGYFVGTGILSAAELLQVYHSLEGQAKHLSDPIALTAYETFQQRLKHLGLDVYDSDPVRKVLAQPIVNPLYLSPLSLAQPVQSARLEEAIQTREVIELRRLVGTGRFSQDLETPFEVLPLQIVFYNIAWYLGYQRAEDALLSYERLERLTARFTQRTQSRSVQKQALRQLEQLQQASYGLYLGRNASEQQRFLSSIAAEHSTAKLDLELWFTTDLFRFICEGTQRFPGVKMSSRKPLGISMSAAEQQDIFTLKGTKNDRFPHRLKAQLPCWTIESIDLKRWILSCADQVKVIAPESLAQELMTCR